MLDPAEWAQIEERFKNWAMEQPAIRATIIVGSRSRTEPPGDEWSDLDLMLFIAGRSDYYQNNEWLDEMGEVWASVRGQTAGGDPEWLVTYADGYNVDYVLLDYGSLTGLIRANPLPEPYVRGYRILIDKDGLAGQIPAIPAHPPTPALPTAEEFNQMVTTFWYIAFYMAKQIRRDELYLVRMRDNNLKECLLSMLIWHTLATQGPETEVWYMGRFMKRWADPEILGEWPGTFACFDKADSWRALRTSMALFRRLTRETSARLGIPYPSLIGERMNGLIAAMENEETPE